MTTEKQQNETYFAMLLASIVSIMPFSLDTYLPAMPTIADALQTDIHQIEITIGFFLIGSAVAQLFGGPFSDRNGRRVTVLIGLSIYIVGAFGLAISDTVWQFKLARLIQAFGSGCATVVVSATVRDRFSGSEAARIFALIAIIMMGAPLFAPIIGSILLKSFGWRSIFLFLAGYASFVFVVVFVFFKSMPSARKTRDVKTPIVLQVARNYMTVLQTRQALGFLAIQAASMASMLAFLTEVPFVYLELYEIPESNFAWFFGCNIITMAIFNRITAFKLKTTAPQKILLFGLVLQLTVNVSLFLFAQMGLPPFSVVLPLIMISVGSQGFIAANAAACYMDYFKENSGTANAVVGTLASFIAAGVGILTARLHDGESILPMASMMCLSSLVGATLLFWLSEDMRGVLREVRKR